MPDYEFMRRARTPPCRRLPCDPAARSAGVGRLLPFAKPSGGNRPGRQEAPRRMTTQKKRAPRRKRRGKIARRDTKPLISTLCAGRAPKAAKTPENCQ